MNHRFIRLALLAALPLATGNFAPQVGAKPARKSSSARTVLDYGKLLPWNYTELSPQEFERHVVVLDKTNDYLEVAVGDSGIGFTMALFRYQGRVLVALRTDGTSNGFDLLRFESGRWRNVTKSLVPKYNPYHIYEVPRRGTTIRVFDNLNTKEDAAAAAEKGRHLYDLIWRNGRFQIR